MVIVDSCGKILTSIHTMSNLFCKKNVQYAFNIDKVDTGIGQQRSTGLPPTPTCVNAST